jgi:hypothetical protein
MIRTKFCGFAALLRSQAHNNRVSESIDESIDVKLHALSNLASCYLQGNRGTFTRVRCIE